MIDSAQYYDPMLLFPVWMQHIYRAQAQSNQPQPKLQNVLCPHLKKPVTNKWSLNRFTCLFQALYNIILSTMPHFISFSIPLLIAHTSYQISEAKFLQAKFSNYLSQSSKTGNNNNYCILHCSHFQQTNVLYNSDICIFITSYLISIFSDQYHIQIYIIDVDIRDCVHYHFNVLQSGSFLVTVDLIYSYLIQWQKIYKYFLQI